MPQQSEVAVGPTTAQALREIADWLEQHPDLAAKMNARIGFATFSRDAREELAELADALGDRLVERATSSNVEISREFGPGAIVFGWTTPDLVGAKKPVAAPSYDPILGARS